MSVSAGRASSSRSDTAAQIGIYRRRCIYAPPAALVERVTTALATGNVALFFLPRHSSEYRKKLPDIPGWCFRQGWPTPGDSSSSSAMSRVDEQQRPFPQRNQALWMSIRFWPRCVSAGSKGPEGITWLSTGKFKCT